MKKLTIAIMLLISAIFTLSADKLKDLKTRHVGGPYEKPATVILYSGTTDKDTVYYGVFWAEEDGSDIVNVYICPSIEYAFNVWNMSRDEIESKRQIMNEKASDLGEDDGLYLFRYYILK